MSTREVSSTSGKVYDHQSADLASEFYLTGSPISTFFVTLTCVSQYIDCYSYTPPPPPPHTAPPPPPPAHTHTQFVRMVGEMHTVCTSVHPAHNTVKPQWLEPLWDHENLFEIWVVRAIED